MAEQPQQIPERAAVAGAGRPSVEPAAQPLTALGESLAAVMASRPPTSEEARAAMALVLGWMVAQLSTEAGQGAPAKVGPQEWELLLEEAVSLALRVEVVAGWSQAVTCSDSRRREALRTATLQGAGVRQAPQTTAPLEPQAPRDSTAFSPCLGSAEAVVVAQGTLPVLTVEPGGIQGRVEAEAGIRPMEAQAGMGRPAAMGPVLSSVGSKKG